MLSMLLCLSCVYVGMTAVFADDAEYTPVVSLTPEMYSPKTVYVDDDFNNRDTTGTSLSTVAEDKEQYAHQVIMKANGKSVTNYELGSDETDIYAKTSANNKSMAFLDYNNKDVDKISVSFRFRFPEYSPGMYFLVKATQAGDATSQNILKFIVSSKDPTSYSIYYYMSGDTNTHWTANITTQGTNTWNRANFQLERVADEENPGSYNVYIRKLSFTNSAGTVTNVDTSKLSPINADWWSGSITNDKIVNAANVALRISSNTGGKVDGATQTANVHIDDVIVYEPDDLKMKGASYDSAAGKVKAVFTRGLNADTLSGITIKSGENVIAATAALDPTDTSNRTVLVNPTAALDVENESYIVTASGVTDLEGNAVPENSVSFGKQAIKVENAKYYVNDVEVTEAKVNASVGQTVSAKADVTNPTDANAEIMPIIAYYEDGVLKCVNAASTVTVNAGASAQLSASFTMPDTDGTNGEFKFFAFKDGKLAPIMGALQKERFNNESATVFLLGDSLCENFTSAARKKPQTGWGQTIGSLLADNVTVKDYAYSGFSTKTYMDCENYSGNWVTRTWSSETMVNKSGETVAANPILAEVNAGDYVIVALGKEDKNINLAEETYKGYLKQMAADTKAKGAEIIFVTPTISTKTPLSTDPATAFTNTYDSRARMMKAAAAECGAVCLDLGTAMTEYYNTITENATTNLDTIRGYHLYQSILTKSVEDGGFGLTSDEIANHGNATVKAGNDDAENLSSRGAEMVSRIIVTLLGSSGSNLKYYIK